MKRHSSRPAERGISLVEALLALAVMAIGMLGIVGVQSSLRSNADISRQRSEALRLAQQEVERSRSFVALTTAVASPSYEALLVDGTQVETGLTAAAGGSTSTFFSRTRTVSDLPAPANGKVLTVEVTWKDRFDIDQSIKLMTVVNAVSPTLASTMVVPGDGDIVRRPHGRNRGIPVMARDLGDGTSAMKPPGATDTTLAWRFDNVTGLITICATTAATTGDLLTTNLVCGSERRMLLAGYLRYVLGTTQPTADQAANPTSLLAVPPQVRVHYANDGGGDVNCLQLNVTSPSQYTSYYCAIPVSVVPPATPTWWGDVHFDNTSSQMASSMAEASNSLYRACRYPATHASYVAVATPLINENYLIIPAGSLISPVFGTGAPFNCPAPTVAFQPS